ncbi:SOS response-associated peptidase family protein [Roseateles sp. LYH14W]|uniref:Abasic site processing protein n=1 Tax=Pelomonas parva TaxID=3299032 RepID=A0ABW7F835_9BURK
MAQELAMRCDYEPLMDAGRMLAAFGVAPPTEGALTVPADGASAVFIVPGQAPELGVLGEVRLGRFGLLPPAARDGGDALRVRECPVETMKSNPTCRESWWAGRRCVVPVARLTTWCHDTGRPQPWGIQRADGDALGLAGLWHEAEGPGGERVAAFCVLTLSAAGHAVFGHLAPPMAQDPRMPAILGGAAQRRWLQGTWAEAERLLICFPAEQLDAGPLAPADPAAQRPAPGVGVADLFEGEAWLPMPASARRPREAQRRAVRPVAVGPVTGDLFA